MRMMKFKQLALKLKHKFRVKFKPENFQFCLNQPDKGTITSLVIIMRKLNIWTPTKIMKLTKAYLMIKKIKQFHKINKKSKTINQI